MIGLAGETDTLVRFERSTVTDAVFDTPLNEAVMVTGPPTLLPIARPVLAVMETVPGLEEVQEQTLVMSC